MTPSHRHLFLFLFVIIGVGGVLLFRQMFLASKFSTEQGKDYIVSPNTFDIPLDGSEPTLGNPGAPITITLFNSIGCSDCKKAYDTLSTFVLAHPTEVKLVWKAIPEKTLFRNSMLVHRAAFCADQQKKFWPFLNKAMDTKSLGNQDVLKNIAVDVKINTLQWQQCLTSEKAALFIAQATLANKAVEATTPPTVFINDKKINLKNNINLDQLLNSLIE